jgi:hypothetical protein
MNKSTINIVISEVLGLQFIYFRIYAIQLSE